MTKEHPGRPKETKYRWKPLKRTNFMEKYLKRIYKEYKCNYCGESTNDTTLLPNKLRRCGRCALPPEERSELFVKEGEGLIIAPDSELVTRKLIVKPGEQK